MKRKNLKKQKKEKLEYDEVLDEFVPARGAVGHKVVDRDWVIEAKGPLTRLPDGVDPFLLKAENKRINKAINKAHQLANIAKQAEKEGRIVPPPEIKIGSTVISAKSTNRIYRKILKAKKKEYKNLITPKELDKSYETARFSTASMGLFDDKHELEPKRRNELKAAKRKETYKPNEFKSDENEEAIKIANRILKVQGSKKQKFVPRATAIHQTNVQQEKRSKKRQHALAANKERFKKKKKTEE